MVHLLTSHLRFEFLAVPELVRFDMARGQDGLEPTLLIKATSLSLKYLLRRKAMRFVIATVGRKLVYGVEIPDDPETPALAWSLVGLPAEVTALQTLIRNPRCVVFLFNELALSVAWTEIELRIDPSFVELLQSAKLHPPKEAHNDKAVAARIDEVRHSPLPGSQAVSLGDLDWKELRQTYITNRMGSSPVSLFHQDEGGQQEEIAVWLTDALQPEGCVKSPFVEAKPRRELSDVMLTYEYGTILIESKALNILTRDVLPDRGKLARDIVKDVAKGAKQLAGGIRKLKSGIAVTDKDGKELEVERTQPVHAIILVPDLSLLQDATEFGGAFFRDFMQTTGGFLHILDPAELLRVVQAGEMRAEKSEIVTPIMAFDFFLMERAKAVKNNETPYASVLFRRHPDDEIPDEQ